MLVTFGRPAIAINAIDSVAMIEIALIVCWYQQFRVDSRVYIETNLENLDV